MKALKILALVMLCLAMSPAGAKAWSYNEDKYLGRSMPDFSVTTIDGETFTLSEVLQDRELVFINLWATWCPYCRDEFPYLEEAYEMYKDRVAVIALSTEPEDTVPVLAQFAREYSLTFSVGSDQESALGAWFDIAVIPTSVIVDRFGNIVWMGEEQDSTESFIRLFDWFLRGEYTESEPYHGLPPVKPDAEGISESELDQALNTSGGTIRFRNPDDSYIWPVIFAEKDGRPAVAAGNSGRGESASAVTASVTARQDEALAFDLSTSTESGHDLLKVYVDGGRVKAFGGEHGWQTWVVGLSAGEHEIVFSYEKDAAGDAGDDCVWLDEVRLVSAAEADALRAGLPVYAVADEAGLRVVSPGAKEIVFEGSGAASLPWYFHSSEFWIVFGDAVEVEAVLTADLDPDAAVFFSDYDQCEASVRDCWDPARNGSFFTGSVDSADRTGYSWTEVFLYPDAGDHYSYCAVMVFAGEAEANEFASRMEEQLVREITWRYADAEKTGG